MDAKVDAPLNHAAADDDSLVRGGPFYRLQRALGLIRPNQWNLGRRVTFSSLLLGSRCWFLLSS